MTAVLTAAIAIGGVQLTRATSGGGTATSVVPVEPYRILDTRNGIGAPAAPIAGGGTIDVQIAGVGPVPADAVGVVLNVTGTRTSEATYITAWPTGAAMPTASVLNLSPGIDAPNAVTALLGQGGQVSFFNFTGSTDLIADVAGYLIPATGGGGGQPGPAGPQGPTGPQGPPGPSAATYANLVEPDELTTQATMLASSGGAGGGGPITVASPTRFIMNAIVEVGYWGGTAPPQSVSCVGRIYKMRDPDWVDAGRAFTYSSPAIDPNRGRSAVLPITVVVDRPAGRYDFSVWCSQSNATTFGVIVWGVSLAVTAVARPA